MPWSKITESILRNSDKTSILLMNQEGIILDINTAMTKTFGFGREDLVNKNFRILFTEEDQLKNLPEQELETVLKEGSALDENYIVQKNGEPLWCFGESICVQKDGEELILKIIFNIHKQKVLETHLISKNEELKQAQQNLIIINEELTKKVSALNHTNQELDNFVYRVSHDLKAPLHNLETLMGILEKQVQFSDASEKTRQMITRSIIKLKSLLNDLAATAKAETGQAALPELVTLQEMMEEVKFNLKHQIEVSRAVIEEDFSELPSVAISKKDIISILQNLVSNAIKYRSPERPLYIKTEAKLFNHHYVLFTVVDNGMGIQEEDQEKIFSIYTRVHKHIEGTGVGLAIVKRIAENHGGKVEVESKPEIGSSFKVYLKQSF